MPRGANKPTTHKKVGRPRLKIKKGDTVVVICGKYKGVTGAVSSVDPEKQRVVVEGVNKVKRHQKARPPMNPQQASRQPRPEHQGGIIEREAPLHISNVQIVNPGTGERARVGFRTTKDGHKVRTARRGTSAQPVDLDK